MACIVPVALQGVQNKTDDIIKQRSIEQDRKKSVQDLHLLNPYTNGVTYITYQVRRDVFNGRCTLKRAKGTEGAGHRLHLPAFFVQSYRTVKYTSDPV